MFHEPSKSLENCTLKLSLRAKILGAFFVVLGLFVAVLVYGVAVIQQSSQELSILQERYVGLTKVVSRLETQGQWLERYDLERMLNDRPQLPHMYRGLVNNHTRAMNDSLQDCEGLLSLAMATSIDGDGANKLNALRLSFKDLRTDYDSYEAVLNGVFDAPGDGEDPGAASAQLKVELANVAKSLRVFSELLDERTADAVSQARNNLEQATLAGKTFSGVAVFLGLIVIFLTNLVLRPIERLTEGVKEVSKGRYQSRVDIGGSDEIAMLASEFNAMAASLEERDRSLSRQRDELQVAYKTLQTTNYDLQALSLYNANIVQSMSVGLVACDPDDIITTVNPSAESILHLNGRELLGKNINTLSLVDVGEHVEAVRGTGRLTRQEGVPLRGESGEVARLLDYVAVPLAGADKNRSEGVVLLIEDVTERTAIRQRLQLTERLALIGRMSAQVTHEIRNPLNALGLNTELLEEELTFLKVPKDHEGRVLLASIAKEIDRLTAITEQYLSLARRPKPHLELENVGEIVSSLLQFMAEEALRLKVTIDLSVSPGLPQILVDESQLRQALLNIFRNSLEASGPASLVRIRVEKQGDGVEVNIIDGGEGMEPERLARIFDPFFSTKERGTGLGLPVTQQIIEEHRGRISCVSEAGVGTTFCIWLPASIGLGHDTSFPTENDS